MKDLENRIISLFDKNNKTFLVHSLGCRTNTAEVYQIAGWLESLGYVSSSTRPGLIVVNTCAVTKKGLSESVRSIKTFQKKFSNSRVIAIGCGVNKNIERFKGADLVVSNEQKEEIFMNKSFVLSRNIGGLSKSARLILRIQSGCNHFCSYCIVPYLRKEIFSHSPVEIVNKITKGQQQGYREVILTGTNLELYGKEKKYSFTDLLEAILTKTIVLRISLGSINYETFDSKLIKMCRSEWQKEGGRRLSRYLHIPLQSGSDDILKKMNRPYLAEEFGSLIFKLTKGLPLVNIGTDIIVGFPGETDQDFEKTVKFINKHPFSRLHIFRYSSRRKTLAEKMEREWGAVSPEKVGKRSKILRQIGKEKETEFRKKIKGKTLPVLFFKRKDKNNWWGLTDNYQTVAYKSKKNLRGQIKKIKIS